MFINILFFRNDIFIWFLSLMFWFYFLINMFLVIRHISFFTTRERTNDFLSKTRKIVLNFSIKNHVFDKSPSKAIKDYNQVRNITRLCIVETWRRKVLSKFLLFTPRSDLYINFAVYECKANAKLLSWQLDWRIFKEAL